MKLPQLALREAQLTLQLSKIKKELSAVRTALEEALEKAQEETGTRQIYVTLPDGTRVGTIGLTEDTRRAVVADEKAFTGWVIKHHPEEIKRSFVSEIRPAFQKRIFGEIEKNNTTEITDHETGEILTIPGVEITTTREGSHTLRWKAGEQSKAAVRNTLPHY
jgi:hypothetical protein